MQTLKFNYYDEFACTGPECEDNCCKHWSIFLTKREYLDYKKMDCSPELKAVINSAFKRNKGGSDFHYAKMDLKEDGSCHFLGEDGLCMIQKEKGESALTAVCSVFPRNWHQIGKNTAVFTMKPTCYHVVELLMQHPEGLTLVEGEYDNSNKWINKNYWAGKVLNDDAETLPYIWSIKTAQTDILQNRDFTIPERLLILGYYTNKVCEYLESSPEKIDQLGAMMLDKELTRKIADSLKANQNAKQSASKSADMLFRITEYVRRVAPDSHVNNLLNAIAENTGLEFEYTDKGKATISVSEEGDYNVQNLAPECQVTVNLDALSKNFEIYSEIEADRPHIIENLLVNQAFSMFSKNKTELWADYFALAVLYNFLQFYTAAFLPEHYTDKELAMAVTNIVKIIVNTNLARSVIMNDYARHGANSLSHVAFLIN